MPIKTEKGFWYSWRDMKRRCTSPAIPDYKHYGGRGITYDRKWEAFSSFKTDMLTGWFKGATLDRKDVNGNYTKDNCHWILRSQQTTVGRLRKRYNNKTGIVGVEYIEGRGWRVLVRERGKPRGKGAKRVLYSGKDLFEACCIRKAWESKNCA